MKKKIINLTIALMTICIGPTFAGSNETATPINETNKTAKHIVLTERLTEINEMDKSSLSRVEKKDLRKEVKGIEKELKRDNGGIYLSVGAIIIILLVLIILL